MRIELFGEVAFWKPECERPSRTTNVPVPERRSDVNRASNTTKNITVTVTASLLFFTGQNRFGRYSEAGGFAGQKPGVEARSGTSEARQTGPKRVDEGEKKSSYRQLSVGRRQRGERKQIQPEFEYVACFRLTKCIYSFVPS